MSTRLTRLQVAELMGWAGTASVNVALHRSRHPDRFPGSAPFPEPGDDGLWEQAAVEAYRDARSNRGVGLSADEIAQIRRLRAEDDMEVALIAETVGCRPGSVYRVLDRLELR